MYEAASVLLHKTLSGAAAKIDYAGHSRFGIYVHHVQNILNDIEHEIVLLLENVIPAMPTAMPLSGDRGTEDLARALCKQT